MAHRTGSTKSEAEQAQPPALASLQLSRLAKATTQAKRIAAALELDGLPTPAHKLLLVCLIRHMPINSDAPAVCRPSQKTLAKYCGINPNTVSRYLRTLEALGVITIQQRSVNNRNKGNWYALVGHQSHRANGISPPGLMTTPSISPTGHREETELLEETEERDKRDGAKPPIPIRRSGTAPPHQPPGQARERNPAAKSVPENADSHNPEKSVTTHNSAKSVPENAVARAREGRSVDTRTSGAGSLGSDKLRRKRNRSNGRIGKGEPGVSAAQPNGSLDDDAVRRLRLIYGDSYGQFTRGFANAA